jgi:hypothetical protein
LCLLLCDSLGVGLLLRRELLCLRHASAW